MTVGLVAFAFGKRSNDYSPCNVRLAEETTRIVGELTAWEYVVAVCQQEVADVLDWQPDMIAQSYTDDYLDSADVLKAATRKFREHKIERVIPVAHPFLHLQWCERLIERSGFVVQRMPIEKIGFDKQSAQWWTRGPIRLAAYAALCAAGLQEHVRR